MIFYLGGEKIRIHYLQANLRFGPNKKTHFAFYQIKLVFGNKIRVIVSEAAGSLGIVYTNSYSLGNRNPHFSSYKFNPL